MLSVGCWWIRDGLNARRREARRFGERLEERPNVRWEQDHGDSEVLRSHFLHDPGRDEEVDRVDFMYMCSHGDYNPSNSATYGRGFMCWDGAVHCTDDIEWGNFDLEFFSSHACRLLYHSSSNSVGRWVSAFGRLHYMFGFHTISTSGGVSAYRGKKFARYSSRHFDGYNSRTMRRAWKKACVETESNSKEWAYLRANGNRSGGAWVDTYNEVLSSSEPGDPTTAREFFTARGNC